MGPTSGKTPHRSPLGMAAAFRVVADALGPGFASMRAVTGTVTQDRLQISYPTAADATVAADQLDLGGPIEHPWGYEWTGEVAELWVSVTAHAVVPADRDADQRIGEAEDAAFRAALAGSAE